MTSADILFRLAHDKTYHPSQAQQDLKKSYLNDSIRKKFFDECVEKTANGNLKVSLVPHDLFEWFRENI